jgi:hypothetical protein
MERNKRAVFFFCGEPIDPVAGRVLQASAQIHPLEETDMIIDEEPVRKYTDPSDNSFFLVRTQKVVSHGYDRYLPVTPFLGVRPTHLTKWLFLHTFFRCQTYTFDKMVILGLFRNNCKDERGQVYAFDFWPGYEGNRVRNDRSRRSPSCPSLTGSSSTTISNMLPQCQSHQA